jgi:pimeloyl-ACP methyl ester carboxylesterase
MRLVLFFGALCLLVGVKASDTSPQLRTFDYQGVQRTYYVALPSDCRPEAIYWPLVVVHGGGGNAGENKYAVTMRRLADVAGLPAIVIQPQFITEDKQVSRFPSLGEDGFLLAVLEKVRAEFKVHNKILLNGYSMGGQFTHRFALTYPDLVAACAPFAAGTWTTPDGRLLIEEYGEVADPKAFLSTAENSAETPERLRDLFDPRVAGVAGLKAAEGADRVPFLVMCGTLDSRLSMAKEFAAALNVSGYSVETEWPRTPHSSDSPEFMTQYEKYSAEAIAFFNRCTENN